MQAYSKTIQLKSPLYNDGCHLGQMRRGFPSSVWNGTENYLTHVWEAAHAASDKESFVKQFMYETDEDEPVDDNNVYLAFTGLERNGWGASAFVAMTSVTSEEYEVLKGELSRVVYLGTDGADSDNRQVASIHSVLVLTPEEAGLLRVYAQNISADLFEAKFFIAYDLTVSTDDLDLSGLDGDIDKHMSDPIDSEKESLFLYDLRAIGLDLVHGNTTDDDQVTQLTQSLSEVLPDLRRLCRIENLLCKRESNDIQRKRRAAGSIRSTPNRPLKTSKIG